MKRLLGMLTSLTVLVVPVVAVLAAPAQAAPNLVCDGTYAGRTVHNVVIRHRATCVIRNSRITGNVRTTGAPRVVRITDTPIGHNVHIRNVTRRVIIGAAGCRVDPVAGNNVMVRNSHNVAICEMSIDNNLVLRNNSGIIMVRDNRVCNSIRVVRNHVRSMRVLRNAYAGHFRVTRNVVRNRRALRRNVELRGNPATCRRG